MEWTDWVDWKPETKTDIKIKIENDGYTFPHYDKKNNGVKYVISTMDIKQDCLRLGVPFEDVYPLQTTLFNRRKNMASKINVTERIAIIIEKQKIEVVTTLNYDMSISFDNKDTAPTLDDNGDLFEPVYKCKVKAIPKNDVFFTSLTRVKSNIKTLQEVKKSFEFVNENRENLFEMAGFKGVLE
ncbi:TPA: hypothetical protein ACOO5Y_001058 [Streptococcus pneumoniae]